jgi:hypothetical protein
MHRFVCAGCQEPVRLAPRPIRSRSLYSDMSMSYRALMIVRKPVLAPEEPTQKPSVLRQV